jgi:hypothetical protein
MAQGPLSARLAHFVGEDEAVIRPQLSNFQPRLEMILPMFGQ